MLRTTLFFPILLALTLGVAGQPIKDRSAFEREFSDALKADNYAKQKDLVQTYPQFAVDTFHDGESSWCSASLKGEDGKTGADLIALIMETLATIYKQVPPKSEYLLQRLRWLRELSPEQKALKPKTWDLVGEIYSKYEAAGKARVDTGTRELMPQCRELIDLSEKITDYYWAAQGYWYLSKLYTFLKEPEYFEAVYYAKRAIEIGAKGFSAEVVRRQDIDGDVKRLCLAGKIRSDLVDTTLPLDEAKAKYKADSEKTSADVASGAGAGAGDGTAGKGPGVAEGALPPGPKPNAHGGKTEWEDTTDLKLSAVNADLPFSLTSYKYSTNWYEWYSVKIAKGQTTPVTILPGTPEIENDGGKLFLHPAGKGKSKDPIRLKLGAKPEVQEFDGAKYSDGSPAKIWHQVFQLPSNYNLNGFQQRPDAPWVLYRGATQAKGKVRGQDFTIFDTDGNGRFNDFGIDCIATGSGKSLRVQPLSRYITIADLFYELTIEEHGKKLRTRPYDAQIAVVKLDYKANMKPAFLLARGTNDDATYFFDLMQAIDHPIWVVPGTCVFFDGCIVQGKGDKAQSIHISNDKTGSFKVEPGQLNVWKMGGAGDGFRYSFKVETDKVNGEEIIRIPAKEVRLVGAFGERYERSMFGAELPTVLIRKGKESSPVATEKMKKPENSDLKEGDAIWYAKTFETKKQFPGEFGVKLESDCKQLGKVTSEWTSPTN